MRRIQTTLLSAGIFPLKILPKLLVLLLLLSSRSLPKASAQSTASFSKPTSLSQSTRVAQPIPSSQSTTLAQPLPLSQAQLVVATTDTHFLLRTVAVLQEEVQKRTGIRLPLAQKPYAPKKLPYPKKPTSPEGKPTILLVRESDSARLTDQQRRALAALPPIQAEGYRILTLPEEKILLIVGKDARGLLYGVGRLLRKMEMRPGELLLKEALTLASSPVHSLRGHQLGYRAKTNAYDAFSVAQYDQYIRDLALFGANSIEILPPRTDDELTSPHMKLPPARMIVEQSRICQEYGLDVWMWYPNVGKDYKRPDSIQSELDQRQKVFASLPRLNNLFVPAGDPGDLQPDDLFGWLEKEAVVLRKYHPGAKIWVSPQGFNTNQQWFDAFFAHVNRRYPWFGGVVFGPWVKIPLARLRQLVDPAIPIRHYPDITHSMNCQYPYSHWDLSWALTLGRECINPRPYDEKTIHNAFDRFCVGSISYSEGTNDDVNKFVWSDQDWNPATPVIETLRDYTRLFMGPDVAEAATQGIIGLEDNMKGPALTSEGIDRTLQQWQRMERNAAPRLQQNARFQMCLIRAYFDAYTRRRGLYEKELEQQAKDLLETADNAILAGTGAIPTPGTIDINKTISAARTILWQTVQSPILPEYRSKCMALADSLYKSIGAQLTVKRHGGMPERGNFIDFIDFPLTDVPWWLQQLAAAEKQPTDSGKIRLLREALHRTDPGPGGFYDHFGDPLSWRRVLPGPLSWAQDPGNLESPHTGFGVALEGVHWMDNPMAPGFTGPVVPKSWMKQGMTLYSTPLTIHYAGLDSGADYRLRLVYTGRFHSHVKLTTGSGYLIHDFIRTGIQPVYEFDLPKAAIKKGEVTFVWKSAEEDRGAQVTELWLLRK